MNKQKIILIIICLALVACKGRKTDAPSYECEAIAYGSMENSVTATGTVEPISKVEVGTQVSGIIDKIYVDYNSRVKQGQIIAELDKTVLEQELNSYYSDLKSMQNEFDYRSKEFERSKKLFEKNLISQSEYDEALYNYNRTKNNYEKAQSSYKKAKTNLGYATIYSPIDGIVLSKAVDEGQTVAASFSTPTLFTIANNLSQMRVIANVDEADIGQVSEGMEVSFYVDAYPNDVFEGKVSSVRLEPTTTSNVVTYEVVIEAPNPEEKLKPGLTANVSIYSMRKSNVLLLPLRATRQLAGEPTGGGGGKADFGQQSAGAATAQTAGKTAKVLVKTPSGEPKVQEVSLGESDGIYYEVLSGLKEGDEVVVGFASEAAPGFEAQKNSSPFMPQRPGANKNSGKKS